MAFQSPHRGQNPPELLKVSGYIPANRHKYFERMTLGHGYITFFIHTFYEKLEAACRNAGIPEGWDPDTEDKMNALLKNLNFNPQPATPVENGKKPVAKKKSSQV